MAEHLGYDKHDPAGRNRGNSRNGTSRKTVTTEIGKVTLDVPRDREGTFSPQVVAKHQRRLAGFDQAVVSLYAKGMTTGDIVEHLSEVYDTDVSRDLVSRVTDQVLADMKAWQARDVLDTGNGVCEKCQSLTSLSPRAGRNGSLPRGYAQLGVDPQLRWGIPAPVLRSMVLRDAGGHP